MVVNVIDLKKHMRVDHDEEDDVIENMALAAEELIYTQTGKRFQTNLIAIQCIKILVTDMYNSRGIEGDVKYSKTAEMLISALSYQEVL